MKTFIIRLDDACKKMDIQKWNKMEILLDKYGIKPLVGVIPNCQDVEMDKYPEDDYFWEKVSLWIAKGWEIAMHGYNHVYSTKNGGINPINMRSEFAGETLEIQREKIKKGLKIFKEKGIVPKAFFAPSHTFDMITLEALMLESDIRVISDTIATDSYNKNGFMFVPVQSGKVRKLPFKTVTFCYHPNIMNEADFLTLELFLEKNRNKCIRFPTKKTARKLCIFDYLAKLFYYQRIKIKRLIKRSI